ncbi:probable glutamate receptor [Trichonephila inaurata madagascariensis]|uniref:Probable glutamate receptor n=1 Tax=Trichonephila inaurata madagascariensis TaxID=2747483 RepID=A0A8X6Y256_9ARAC|nr:probable glutamate receptor [Trichonephila inaurata madagascariensis]
MLHLKVVTMNITHIFQAHKDKNGTLRGFSGTDFPLLQMLSKHLPFSYDLLVRTDYAFGSIDKNGEWTGMIGMLKRNEADMALGWMSNTYDRQKVVDFSFPYLIDSIIFITATPKNLQRELPFVNPFQSLVWIYLLISLVLSGFALSILSIPITGNKNGKESFFGRWFKEIRKIFALLLGQGRYDYYRSNKVRVFMYLWSLSKLVLVFSYLSDLLASLMIPIKERPLKNVQELNDAVVAEKYKFGTLNGSYLLNYLMEFKSGIIKDLANHIRHHPENVLGNFSEVVTRIEDEKFAMMIPHLYFVYSASKIGIEKFYAAKDSLGYGMITPIFQVEKDKDGSLYGFGGSDFHLLQMLSKHVPFSYDLMIRTDYAFGSIDANGEWTGMIGMLKRNEVDLAIGWLSNTYERQTVVDFSSPYLLDANVFVTAAPKILQREYPFINPFQPFVWMYLLISLVISGFALSILSTPIGGNKNRKENFFGRWFKEIRRILALLVGQGGQERHHQRSGQPHPPSSRKHPEKFCRQHQEGRGGKIRLHEHAPDFMYSASQIGIERFYVAKDSIGYNVVSIAFRKGFRHMERVNRVIHRITECALYSKIIDGYIFDSQLKAPPPKPLEDKRALSFDDVKMAVRLLMLFHVLSTFCLVIEIGIYKYKMRQARRKQK